ncbi:MAG: toluene tolerance protein [Arcobacter sp.]|nr:MAG: toluene tolerance protein [Arcobacter sp.]
MFKILISTLLIFTSLSFAMTQAEIKSEMSNKIDKVILVLKDSKISKENKITEIIQTMDSTFDYDLMSRLSLGNTWKEISSEQQKQFTELFTKKLKNSYVEKLDLYTDELVHILGTEQTKRNRLTLNTQLIGKESKHDINYKFYKKKNEDNWLIYDVDLIGVSIIQTYRKQFSGFLKEKSFNDLLAFLENSK